MITECCECEKAAFRYWGDRAYCGTHFSDAKRVNPDAHKCIKCGEEQPRHVMWRRDKPCRSCNG